jgi:hypothetical protein
MMRLLLIVLLAATMPATAQARKTARVRVTEAFAVLPPQMLARERAIAAAPRSVWFKPLPRFIANRPASTHGKLMIYRECGST